MDFGRRSFKSLSRQQAEALPPPVVMPKPRKGFRNISGGKHGRPRETREGAERRSVSMPRALWADLDEIIAEREETMSVFVRRALRVAIKKQRFDVTSRENRLKQREPDPEEGN